MTGILDRRSEVWKNQEETMAKQRWFQLGIVCHDVVAGKPISVEKKLLI
jgi:hypothetical protein